MSYGKQPIPDGLRNMPKNIQKFLNFAICQDQLRPTSSDQIPCKAKGNHNPNITIKSFVKYYGDLSRGFCGSGDHDVTLGDGP
jgi:hypothetical protein